MHADKFSVYQIEYPHGGSSKKSGDVYLPLIVTIVLLLWRQNVPLSHQTNIYMRQ